MPPKNKKGNKKDASGANPTDGEKTENQADANPEATNDAPHEEKKETDTNATETTQSDTASTTTTQENPSTETHSEPVTTQPEATQPESDKKDLKIDTEDTTVTTAVKPESPKNEIPPEKPIEKPVETKPETPKKETVVEVPKEVEKTPEKKEPEAPPAKEATVNVTSDKKDLPKQSSPDEKINSAKKDDEPVIVEDKSKSAPLDKSLNSSYVLVDKAPSETASNVAQQDDDSRSESFSTTSVRSSIDNSTTKVQNEQRNTKEVIAKAEKAYDLAIQNRNKGDYPTAINNLNAAIETLETIKSEGQVVYDKVTTYTLEISQTEYQQKNYDRALDAALAINKRDANNVRAIYLMGQAYAGKNDNAAATKAFTLVKSVKNPSDTATVKLIEGELAKLEEKSKSTSTSQVQQKTEVAAPKTEAPKAEAPKTDAPKAEASKQGKPEEEKKSGDVKTGDKPKEEEGSGVGVQLVGGFAGTAILTFVLGKFLFKLPQKTTLIASGVLGVVGAVTGYFIDKGSEGKGTKKEK